MKPNIRIRLNGGSKSASHQSSTNTDKPSAVQGIHSNQTSSERVPVPITHVFTALPDWQHERVEILNGVANIYETWAAQIREHIKGQVESATSN